MEGIFGHAVIISVHMYRVYVYLQINVVLQVLFSELIFVMYFAMGRSNSEIIHYATKAITILSLYDVDFRLVFLGLHV